MFVLNPSIGTDGSLNWNLTLEIPQTTKYKPLLYCYKELSIEPAHDPIPAHPLKIRFPIFSAPGRICG